MTGRTRTGGLTIGLACAGTRAELVATCTLVRSSKTGKAYLQPLKKGVKFAGPTIIYPINQSADTPLSDFTVTDVVRNTLGVGPCQYILDLEGQGLAFQRESLLARHAIS